jgi:nucleoside-diphosphate-sugar epimerase
VFLLTGAAGAIGRPLLSELARRANVDRVYAIEHHDRLEEADRICAVQGDVTVGPGLGLSAARLDELTSVVTAIVHAAADTRFGVTADVAQRTNVGGTSNVLAFAERCRKLDRLLALSTTHVAGRRTGRILEHQLEHAAGFVNQYEASKYHAEVALRARMPDLPVAVCRVSTAIGDSVAGTIARQGAIHHAVRLMYAGLAPMIPGDEDSPVDFVAVDHVARAVAWLATDGFEARRTWHLCAGSDTIRAGELLDLTMDCFVQYRPAWRRRAIERPAIVNLPTFELFCHSAEQAGTPTLRAAAAVMAAFAPQLAFPKQFDDAACRAALAAAGIVAPPARETWTRVVRHLITPSA